MLGEVTGTAMSDRTIDLILADRWLANCRRGWLTQDETVTRLIDCGMIKGEAIAAVLRSLVDPHYELWLEADDEQVSGPATTVEQDYGAIVLYVEEFSE
jgi:predicted component of viral defense system (DUF524 family)